MGRGGGRGREGGEDKGGWGWCVCVPQHCPLRHGEGHVDHGPCPQLRDWHVHLSVDELNLRKPEDVLPQNLWNTPLPPVDELEL